MYFYKLLEEEQAIKAEIDFIENTIVLLRDYPGQFLGIQRPYNNLDDAYVGLSKAKNRLSEVHNKMRKFILGE